MTQKDTTVLRNTGPAVQTPKPSKRTTSTRPAVIQKPPVISTPRGPNRDKGENRG